MVNIVTGANGFLGSHLLKALLARGEEARALVRPGADLSRITGHEDLLARGDLRDIDSLRQAVRGADLIFHCAAVVSDWGHRKVFYDTNVGGTANLLAAARQEGIRRFVHVSTTDVYGFPDREVDESAPYRHRGWSYCDTKIEAEKLVWAAYRDHGLPITVIRPASIYGIDSVTLVKDIVDYLRSGDMIHLGRPPRRAGLLHVDNLAQAILLAANSEAAIGQAYNVTDGTGIDWRTYVDALADACGLERARRTIPRFMAYPLSVIMEAMARAMRKRGRPLLTRMAVEVFCTTQEFNCEKIRRELGYAPRVVFHDFLEELKTLNGIREA
jgi:nucleoside-diphosphate-sugar epimerase